MSIIYNGTTVTAIVYNGTNITEAYYNGTLVFGGSYYFSQSAAWNLASSAYRVIEDSGNTVHTHTPIRSGAWGGGYSNYSSSTFSRGTTYTVRFHVKATGNAVVDSYRAIYIIMSYDEVTQLWSLNARSADSDYSFSFTPSQDNGNLIIQLCGYTGYYPHTWMSNLYINNIHYTFI